MMNRKSRWRWVVFLLIAVSAIWWFSAYGGNDEQGVRHFLRHFLRAVGRALR